MTVSPWSLMHPLSAFLLIAAFLVLSYCPLRRTIQHLLKDPHETEQSGVGRQMASAVCQGIIDGSDTKITMPEPKSKISIPVFTAIVLSLFYAIWRFCCSNRSIAFQRKFLAAYLNSVPIYLRNRILLI